MASMNMEEQLVDEQQPKEEKPINGKSKEPSENMDMNGVDLTKSTEEEMDKELETSTTTMVDLPRGHIKLPPELEQQIFFCLKPATQLKFIAGLGWDFYAMFSHKFLIKVKRIYNPKGNNWKANGIHKDVAISTSGVGIKIKGKPGAVKNIYAMQGFPVSGPDCRADNFPGTILYYYEVKGDLHMSDVGLSDGAIPDNSWIGTYSNSYGLPITGRHYYGCHLAGWTHGFQLPEGAIRSRRVRARDSINVFGCGLVLDPEGNLAIFFTLNGQLLSRKIPISPTVDRLFPAISFWNESSIETNFGDDPANPFQYDIKNCPGLELACI